MSPKTLNAFGWVFIALEFVFCAVLITIGYRREKSGAGKWRVPAAAVIFLYVVLAAAIVFFMLAAIGEAKPWYEVTKPLIIIAFVQLFELVRNLIKKRNTPPV